MVRQIVYVSTASPDLEHEAVGELAAQAAELNAAAGITGLLCFNGRNFLQLIEGDGEPLGALFDRIQRDPRHNGVVSIADQDRPARAFPDRSLHYIHLSHDAEARRAELARHLPADMDADTARMILNFGSMN